MARSYENPMTGPIGSTFTGAANLGNSKAFVAANGQTVSKAAYPELAQAFSGQDLEFLGTFGIQTSNGQMPVATTTSVITSAQTSTYAIYAQQFSFAGTNGITLWSSSNGTDWSLIQVIFDASTLRKVVAIGTDIFVCTTNGLYRTTNGTSFTKILSERVDDICFDGTTYLIVNTTTSAKTTTNLTSFTNITLPQNGQGCVFFGTRFYVAYNSTAFIYSTDLSSWSTTAITTPVSTSGNLVIVLNGNLIFWTNANSAPLFRYNTDPLVNAWSSSSTNYNSTNHSQISGMLYDSGLNQYVLTVNVNTTTAGGLFGYLFTTLALSGTSVQTNNTTQNSFTTFATIFGSDRAWHVGPHYSIKSSTWLTGSQSISATGVYANPFFGMATSYWSRGGQTHSGNRWLGKIVGWSSNATYLSVMVEQNGVFKPLVGSVSDPWSISLGSALPTWIVFYEDSAGYAITSGPTSTSYFYATFNTSRTRLSSNTSATPDATTSIFFGCKNSGIHAFSLSSAASIVNYRLTTSSTTGFANTGSLTLVTTSIPYHWHINNATGQFIVTQINSTPTTSPTYYVYNNGVYSSSNGILLYNTSGASVSVTTDCKVFILNGTYYCANNGVLYRSTNNGISFNQIAVCPGLGGGITIGIEFSPGTILGNFKASDYFGTPLIQTLTGTPTMNTGGEPLLFEANSNLAFGSFISGTTSSGYQYESTTNPATEFLVPYISASAGQTAYIVAR